MKITIIHGQSHKGTTCHIARMLAQKISSEKGSITEFFLPRDFSEFCTGCTMCFEKAEERCPHYEKLKPITEAMDNSDVIIFASPVYVYHATGSMKAFLDHYGYRWMVHRPEEKMFSKQVVCIATAAGAGMKSTIKDMADSAFFWGCPKIYKLGYAVAAVSWEKVTPEKMRKIERDTTALAYKIKRNAGKVKPGIKTKGFFAVMKMLQKIGWNKADVDYWKSKGWCDGKTPWKK